MLCWGREVYLLPPTPSSAGPLGRPPRQSLGRQLRNLEAETPFQPEPAKASYRTQVSPEGQSGIIWDIFALASRLWGWVAKFRRVVAGLQGFLARPRAFVFLKAWAPLRLGVRPRVFGTRLRSFWVGLRRFATGLPRDEAHWRVFGACCIGGSLCWI